MAKKVKVSPLIRMLAEIAVDDEIAAQERLAKDPKAVKRVRLGREASKAILDEEAEEFQEVTQPKRPRRKRKPRKS